MSDTINQAPEAPAATAPAAPTKPGYYLARWTTKPNGTRVLIAAGARWHPDWPEARIWVRGFRVFGHGDAIGYRADKVADWTGADDLFGLILLDGEPVTATEAAAELATLGLVAPRAREPIAAFTVKQATDRATIATTTKGA